MTRKEILDKALSCVNGDRDGSHGTPENSFNAIANLWNAYLSASMGRDIEISSEDVAAMMILLKIARVATGAYNDDNWVDIAGYAACGGEIQKPETDEDKAESSFQDRKMDVTKELILSLRKIGADLADISVSHQISISEDARKYGTKYQNFDIDAAVQAEHRRILDAVEYFKARMAEN